MVGGRSEAGSSALPSLRARPWLSSAVVTGLLFLQVPPYPEVFRDSLHTYKLNEQDTDVRAARPLPLSTPAPPPPLPSSSSLSSVGAFPPSISHLLWPFIHLIPVLSHRKDNILPEPPLVLTTHPYLPPWLCVFLH